MFSLAGEDASQLLRKVLRIFRRVASDRLWRAIIRQPRVQQSPDGSELRRGHSESARVDQVLIASAVRRLTNWLKYSIRSAGAIPGSTSADQHPESDAACDYELVLDPRFRTASNWPATLAGRASHPRVPAPRRDCGAGPRSALDRVGRLGATYSAGARWRPTTPPNDGPPTRASRPLPLR